ncbi:MAG TPA: PEP-CTERM sorting domain-containing protein, partial [Reyranella sp.]|nr:PEP-CTERM sorting domain-containing protein [Reyranella sp.]
GVRAWECSLSAKAAVAPVQEPGRPAPSLAGTSPLAGGTSWSFSTSNNYTVPLVSATGHAGTSVKGSASSYLTYYVSFVGANGTVAVNVQASGGASAEGPNILNDYGHNVASAWMSIKQYYDNGGTGPELVFAGVGSNERGFSTPGLHTFSLDQTYSFVANAVYQVMMNTNAEAYDGHTSYAYVDPLFSAPAGYSVLTSAGIGNGLVATTPVPAALPLFLGGLGALGLVGWRRKKAACPA